LVAILFSVVPPLATGVSLREVPYPSLIASFVLPFVLVKSEFGPRFEQSRPPSSHSPPFSFSSAPCFFSASDFPRITFFLFATLRSSVFPSEQRPFSQIPLLPCCCFLSRSLLLSSSICYGASLGLPQTTGGFFSCGRACGSINSFPAVSLLSLPSGPYALRNYTAARSVFFFFFFFLVVCVCVGLRRFWLSSRHGVFLRFFPSSKRGFSLVGSPGPSRVFSPMPMS